ncbi:MAG TPA: polyprenyl synthetase family protein, partial [Methanomassiliicoccales archaeon]|nr:polyprenyl synthetase family protein [Methanomassiliicoccales archaeon]
MDEDITRMLLGGKRLRGALVLLAFDTLSDDQERRKTALDLAAVVELTHSISLILDDIIDEDVVRRGESALHVNNGEKLAFLKMVDCIALPYRIAAGYGGDLVEQLATTHRQMVRGVREEATRSVNPTPERYERIISLKTGALFGLAARYGAFAADADSDVLEAMSEFGMWTGRAMQIADDVADLRLALEGGS